MLDAAVYHNNPIPTEVAVVLQNQTLEEKEFMTFEKITEWYRAWGGVAMCLSAVARTRRYSPTLSQTR